MKDVHAYGVELKAGYDRMPVSYTHLALLGVLLAVVQFVPEMAQKRLKLTLHLPFPQWKMILLMSGIGLGALALLFIVQTAVLWGYFHALLAPELVARILLTALPWYLAGLTLYLLTAWICLEPTWKRRLANLLIAVGVCRIFFLSDTPQAVSYTHLAHLPT